MSIAFSLERRKRQDTGEVIPQLAKLLLTEIADDMVALVVILRHHIKVEGRYVEVECLVVEEEFGDIRDVLAVDALVVVSISINFKNRYVVLAVNLVSRGALHHSYDLQLQRMYISAYGDEALGMSEKS